MGQHDEAGVHVWDGGRFLVVSEWRSALLMSAESVHFLVLDAVEFSLRD